MIIGFEVSESDLISKIFAEKYRYSVLAARIRESRDASLSSPCVYLQERGTGWGNHTRTAQVDHEKESPAQITPFLFKLE